MNGTVTRINRQTGSGAILSAEGRTLEFDLAAVSAYDAAVLTAGKSVYFEVDGSAVPRAIHISSDPVSGVSSSKDRERKLMQVRYMGFEHRGSMRSFRFRRIVPGEAPQNFSVDCDMMLFHQHHVHIQEAPSICLRSLLLGLETAPDARSFVPCSLTAQDLVSFVAGRLAAEGAGLKARAKRNTASS